MRIIITVLLLATTSIAYPFGQEGNRAIATVAEQRLPESTKAKIKQILGNQSMADASAWPDELRSSKAPEAEAFRKQHPNFTNWHSAHIPIDCDVYSRESEFANPNDIVHALDTCVDVLEGRSSKMGQGEALRWLIHLVGDLHQPLNVGTYYIKPDFKTRLVVTGDPQKVKGKKHPDAGNRLRVGKRNFNWYWNDFMVSYLVETGRGATLEKIIEDRIVRLKKEHGNHRDWPVLWASDSIHAARKAYDGAGFGEYWVHTDQRKKTSEWYINMDLSPRPLHYEDSHLNLAKNQLAKAALRLSELLQAIQWAEPPTAPSVPSVAATKATPSPAESDHVTEETKRRLAIIYGK